MNKYNSRRLFLSMVLFVAVPLTLPIGCSSNSAYWEFANAEKMAEQGETEAALEKMRLAVERSQFDPELTSRLALKLAKAGDREALELIERVLDQPIIKGVEIFRSKMLDLKIQCLQYLGNFEDALEIVKGILNEKAVKNGQIRSDHGLNTLAYCRALANKELDQALTEINNAILTRQAATNWKTGERLDLRSKTVLANAVLARHFFLFDKKRTYAGGAADNVSAQPVSLRQAIYLLSRAIEDYERHYLELREGWKKTRNQLNPNPLGLAMESSKIELERQICSTRAGLAVLLTVRALLYQDLQEQEKSYIDRARVAKYKKDADSILAKLPDEVECLELMFYFSAHYLDTRGYVLTKLFETTAADSASDGTRRNARRQFQIASLRPEMIPSFHNAVFDFDTSIMSTQLMQLAIKNGMFNNMNYSVSEVRNIAQTLTHMEAVLRYHRLLAYQKQGVDKEAEEDIKAIIELGFEPGPQLF